MADVGYSPTYEVYLTRANGVQIVTNELSLRILSEMRVRVITLSEMTILFSVSKSTVQSNLRKLANTGIIISDDSVDDGRSVVYHIDAMLLFTSDAPKEWQLYARKACIDRILRNGRCTAKEDLSLYGVSLIESGLNIVPGLFDVGAVIVSMIDDIGWWTELLGNSNTQCKIEGIDIALDLKTNLTLTFRSDHEVISDLPLVIAPMLGAIRFRSRAIVGFNLCYETDLSVEDDGHTVKLKIEPFKGQDFEHKPFGWDVLESGRTNAPFSIYSINGNAMLFSNPTMISVLDALSDGDLSLNELENKLELPKATLFVSVAKLVELGAVQLDENSGSPKKYVLIAEPLLSMSEPYPSGRSILEKLIRDFHDGKLDYYTAVITFALNTLRCMGIHFDRMFVRSGKHVATSVLEKTPDMDPQDFVDLSCRMVSPPDKAEVLRYLPPRIKFIRSPDTLWESWPEEFLRGFLHEGLNTLLGFDCPFYIESVLEKKT